MCAAMMPVSITFAAIPCRSTFPSETPWRQSPILGALDGFVAVIDPAASPLDALVYSSYLTGPGYQYAAGVDVDAEGNIYVTGPVLRRRLRRGGRPIQPPDSNLNLFLLVFTQRLN